MEERIKCDSCGEYFELDEEYKVGDIVSCPVCNEDLRIVSLDPPKTKFIGGEEESEEDSSEDEKNEF